MQKVTNTERLAKEHPELVLAEAMVLGTSNAIEASERAGQAELVASDLLPTDTHDTDAAFEALGFTFGEPSEGDPMFRPATLPEGWTRKGSGHAMWSYIYDERGFRRVSIFYKAAFYDRSAHMGIGRIPETDAQGETFGEIYDAMPPYTSGQPHWSSAVREVREDGAIIARYALRTIHPYPTPEEVHESRTVVVLPDGSVESDVTENVTA